MSINISITAIIFMIITLLSLFLILLSIIYYFKNGSKYFSRLVMPSCIFFIYISSIFFGLIYSKIEPSVFLYFASIYVAVCCFILFLDGTDSIEYKYEDYIPSIDKFITIGINFILAYGCLWLFASVIKMMKMINFSLF